MKKILLIICLLTLSGCYDYTEIDDISIVSGILLDYKDNKYELTLECLDNEKESKTKVYKVTCNDIEECISKVSKESNKELFISHQKVLILTSRTINKSINFYDYFLRNSKSKMNFYVYYIDDQYIDLLFKDKEKNISFYLKDMTDFNTKDFSTSIKLSFIDMIQKIKEKGINNIYPSISIKDDEIILDSLITFKNNNPIILDNNESIIYNIITNNINITSINIPCNKGSFSLNINSSKTKFIIKNDLIISIKDNAFISNYNCKYNLNDDKTIKKLERIANNYIKEKINKILLKNNKTDFIGIERYFYKHKVNNKNIKIQVNTKITSIGESR